MNLSGKAGEPDEFMKYGEGEIRTLGTAYADQLLSRQLRSTTPPPLLKSHIRIMDGLFEIKSFL